MLILQKQQLKLFRHPICVRLAFFMAVTKTKQRNLLDVKKILRISLTMIEPGLARLFAYKNIHAALKEKNECWLI